MFQRFHLTELVIRQHHDKLGHADTNHTRTSLRQRFRIVKSAAAVRHAIRQRFSTLFFCDAKLFKNPICKNSSDPSKFERVKYIKLKQQQIPEIFFNNVKRHCASQVSEIVAQHHSTPNVWNAFHLNDFCICFS